MANRIYVTTYHAPCGDLLLGAIDGKLCLCRWVDELHPGRVDRMLQRLLDAEYVQACTEVTQEAGRQLQEYFDGSRRVFDGLPLLLAGTPFQNLVWQQLLKIPYGATVSYGEIATMAGMPQSVRAVANANGANPVSIIVPCHRVVGSNKSLTGYAGGLAAKQYLLSLECNAGG